MVIGASVRYWFAAFKILPRSMTARSMLRCSPIIGRTHRIARPHSTATRNVRVGLLSCSSVPVNGSPVRACRYPREENQNRNPDGLESRAQNKVLQIHAHIVWG